MAVLTVGKRLALVFAAFLVGSLALIWAFGRVLDQIGL